MKNHRVSSGLLVGVSALLCIGLGIALAQAPSAPKKVVAVSPPAWNPNAVELKEGEAVEFVLKEGQQLQHGVVISNWTAAKEFLEVEFGPLPNIAAPAAATAPNAMLRLRVKKAPPQQTKFKFICTVHGAGMSGELTLTPTAAKK